MNILFFPEAGGRESAGREGGRGGRRDTREPDMVRQRQAEIGNKETGT